jgi:hypothetical protein
VRALSSILRRPIGFAITHGFWISLALACVAFAVFDSAWAGLLFSVLSLAALLVWTRALRAVEVRETAELRLAQDLLQDFDNPSAKRMAGELSLNARTRRVRNQALIAIAWASLRQGRAKRAKRAIDQIQPEHQIDLYCFAAVEHELGQSKIAIQALELAGGLSCDGAKFLVDLYAHQDRFDRAVAAAIAHLEALGVDNGRKIVDAAHRAWALGPAAALAATLFAKTGASEDAVALVRAHAHTRDFVEVDRVVDEIVGGLRERGRLPQARALLAQLSVDQSLPSGVCRELGRKLRSIEEQPALASA